MQLGESVALTRRGFDTVGNDFTKTNRIAAAGDLRIFTRISYERDGVALGSNPPSTKAAHCSHLIRVDLIVVAGAK